MSVPSVPGSRNPEPDEPQARPWGFWASTLWSIAAIVLSTAVVLVAGDVLSIWLPPDSDLFPDDVGQLSRRSALFLGVFAVSVFAMLALAARRSGIEVKTYLGLVLPHRREVIIGISGAILIDATFALANSVSGPFESSEWLDGVYQSAVSAGDLPALALAVILLFPAIEELLFRGFLLPGWAASRLGPTFAILLTSAIWTAMHSQYGWPVLASVYCSGLLLGWLRLRSGSTVLTFFLHATGNAVSVLLVTLSSPSGIANL